MSQYLVKICGIFSLVFALTVQATPPESDIVYSTLPAGPFLPNGSCFGNDELYAVGFLTPAEANYSLDRVLLNLQDVSYADSTQFELYLYDDVLGSPGQPIVSIGTGTGTWDGAPTVDQYTINPSANIQLKKNTNYWLVITSESPRDCPLGWVHSGEDPVGSIFSYAGERVSFDGGSLWIQDQGYHHLQIEATREGGVGRIDGVERTYAEIYNKGCAPISEELEACYEDHGFITETIMPSGNVRYKYLIHSAEEVLFEGEVIQEASYVQENSGLGKEGAPFTWKQDDSAAVCTVNPYTGESVVTTYTHRYANGEFRRLEVKVTYSEC